MKQLSQKDAFQWERDYVSTIARSFLIPGATTYTIMKLYMCIIKWFTKNSLVQLLNKKPDFTITPKKEKVC